MEILSASAGFLDSKRTQPALPRCLYTRNHKLNKKGGAAGGRQGWGLVLRGTTSELEGSLKVYTCHVEELAEDGEAEAQGIQRGDQITSINDIQVRDLDHSRVVKLFQQQYTLTLTTLPSSFLTVGQQIRVTKYNSYVLPSIWALMNNIQALEVIGVNLSKDGVFLGTLINLNTLSLCHCSLSSLTPLRGLQMLQKLRSLSLAHNYLSDDAFAGECSLQSLKQLQKLDLSRNLLSEIPDIIYGLTRLEVLIIVDNNLSILTEKLENLTSLHTLCLDGNLVNDVDHLNRILPTLCNVSFSNNYLECEPEVIRNGHYSITGVENNPYTRSGEGSEDSRAQPTLRRTISVRGFPLSIKLKLKYSATDKDTFTST